MSTGQETTQEQAAPEPTIPVSFRLSTYWKLPKGATGFTHVDSRRLSLSEVLDALLQQLGDDECTLANDGATSVITIHWDRVPEEIRDPFRFGVRR